MKLTRLRLLGFKSFVEPTDFLIEPGLTGVVGPNGCGKSNLVEALRWVMGESSHKAMRAADMDDVIFSGSGNRPARNNAEVAMHIDNSARKAPAQFNEHETLDVSRRIERDSGSTYRINGREVRARDVHILFADASTGSRSPALVHQGRIGEIIQAKPEQRRRVLEEAAGISGLHARRHEAELRLRAAEQNLLRLEDVINQLAGQMEALKNQARQAVRYRNIAAQVRKAEATLFHLRWVAANAELAEAGARQGSGRPRGRGAYRRAGRSRQAASPGRRRAAGLARRRGARGGRVAAARDGARNARAGGGPRARAHGRARPAADPAWRRISSASSGWPPTPRRRWSASAEEEDTLRRGALANGEQRERRRPARGRGRRGAGESEKTFGALTGTLADLTAKRNQFEGAVRSHGERLQRLTSEMAAVETELAELEAADKDRPDVAALAELVAQATAAVAEAEAASLARRSRPFGARAKRSTLRASRLAEAERRAQRLDTEAKTLARLLHVDTKNLWPAVLDDLTVEKGYETALGAALGDDLEAPVDPQAPMRWGGADDRSRRSGTAQGAEPLGRHVTAPPELARRLAQIGVIERADAPRLVDAAQARPAAGLARWRPLALGRFLGRRQCADRRRAPARRQEPPRRYRGRAASRPRRGRSQASAAEAAEAEVAAAAEGRDDGARALARVAARGP